MQLAMKAVELKSVIGDKRPPLIIAHRGAKKEAPENTIAAFRRAIELGCNGIELDVLLTKDKVPVVTHNNDLSILTKSRGHVHLMPFSTVHSLDVGSHFGHKFAGVTMPTLPEALELIEDHNILTIIEIKSQPAMGTSAARLVGGIVSDFRLKGPFMCSSFSVRIVHELKRLYPKIPRALILKRPLIPFLKSRLIAKLERLSAIHPALYVLTEKLVNFAHSNNMQVQTWTANTKEAIEKCIKLNVDGIISDDVGLACRYIKERFTASGR